MSERIRSTEPTETKGTDRYLVDESPELQTSIRRQQDHTPDAYTTGYDPLSETRVGIGGAGGDIEKLLCHNDGRHRSDGDHSIREASRDKKRVTQAFCSYLGVTPYQQREAVGIMGMLNLDRFGRQKRLEKVALATIKVAVQRDRFHKLRQREDLASIEEDEIPTRLVEQEEFADLCDHHNTTEQDIYSLSQLVKRELRKERYFQTENDEQTTEASETDRPQQDE